MNISPDDLRYRRERERAKQIKKTNWWNTIKSKGICYYCGTKVDPSEITMDHVIPISQGGMSSKSNIVPACKSCNNKKKNTNPIDQLFDAIKKSDDAPNNDIV